ncbi:hypothetical protein GCM10011575_30270 [Microlunatus endophyticus]|uniref:Uncharacterized protein n=1 Tax=Microlunatus endophyticus TaxID=1716077 RepID=A0A917W6G8_9ACTN|nr:hypothetical protein GCM10011575_30270 [Microlunatus endophyticus]
MTDPVDQSVPAGEVGGGLVAAVPVEMVADRPRVVEVVGSSPLGRLEEARHAPLRLGTADGVLQLMAENEGDFRLAPARQQAEWNADHSGVAVEDATCVAARLKQVERAEITMTYSLVELGRQQRRRGQDLLQRGRRVVSDARMPGESVQQVLRPPRWVRARCVRGHRTSTDRIQRRSPKVVSSTPKVPRCSA